MLDNIWPSTIYLHLQSVKHLGGTIIEEPKNYSTMTILVAATDANSKVLEPRREKIMNGYCHTSNIVSKEWVNQSFSNRHFLPPDKFRIPSLEPVIRRGIAARDRGGLFGGCDTYICPMVAGKSGLPKKDKLALLFNATGINIINSQQLKSMIKMRKYLPKVVIIVGPCAKVRDSVEEAWALGAKQMKCEDFIKAVENQWCFEECFPLSTKSATSPTGNEVE